ncbi:MAG: hypothetical protein FWE21_02990 [Defluviitaleaceae bacterium]|nr:hypothetical protein [Defluviitaleaceae bacterium]
MKKNFMKALTVATLSAMMVFAMAACGGNDEQEPAETPGIASLEGDIDQDNTPVEPDETGDEVGEADETVEPEEDEATDPVEPEEDEVEEEEEEPAAPTFASADDLLGEWMWMGMSYYTFNQDGSGIMAFMDITWEVDGDVLYICSTPEMCGSTCIAPMRWTFTINGNQLTLDSLDLEGLSYTYTRR